MRKMFGPWFWIRVGGNSWCTSHLPFRRDSTLPMPQSRFTWRQRGASRNRNGAEKNDPSLCRSEASWTRSSNPPPFILNAFMFLPSESCLKATKKISRMKISVLPNVLSKLWYYVDCRLFCLMDSRVASHLDGRLRNPQFQHILLYFHFLRQRPVINPGNLNMKPITVNL